MPQTRPQAFDGLWQCLCPSFDSSALRLTLPRASLARAQLLTTIQPKRCLLTGNPPSLQSTNFWTVDRDKAPLQARSASAAGTISTPWARRAKEAKNEERLEKLAIEAQNRATQLLDGDREIRSLPNGDLHEILCRESELLYFARVQSLVEILVRERGEKPSKAHYQALIAVQANLRYGSAAEVERLLQEMEDNGIDIDSGICSAVFKALAVHPHYMLRCHILKELESSWTALSASDHQNLITGLLKDRQFELAWEQLKKMQTAGIQPSRWLINLFLYTLSSISAWSEVASLLDAHASQPGTQFPPGLWLHLLNAAARDYHQPVVREVWNRAVRMKIINPPSGLCTTVLESCAASGDAILAADVFRVLTQRSSPLQLWHYESLLEAYLVSSDIEGVLSTMDIMTSANFPLSEASTRAMFTTFRENPDMIADALGIITTPSLRSERPVPLVFMNTILEAMCQQGDLDTAIDTFHKLEQFTPYPANVATLNILLQGCTAAARKDVAMSLVKEMRQRGILPTALTYDRLVLVCLSTKKQDDVEDAWKYYNELKAATPWHDPAAADRWGLRRGTVKVLVDSCTPSRDERAWRLLDQCTEEGMDVSVLRKQLESRWEEKWGPDSIPVSDGTGIHKTFSMVTSSANEQSSLSI